MFGRLCPLEGTFAYTGELGSVTYAPGELAPDAPASTVDELIETALRYEKGYEKMTTERAPSPRSIAS